MLYNVDDPSFIYALMLFEDIVLYIIILLMHNNIKVIATIIIIFFNFFIFLYKKVKGDREPYYNIVLYNTILKEILVIIE